MLVIRLLVFKITIILFIYLFVIMLLDRIKYLNLSFQKFNFLKNN